jgi:Family of unknown function (DUF6011)
MRLGHYDYRTNEAFDSHGVLLGRFSDRNEARVAMYAARLPQSFWSGQSVPPIPLLRQFDTWVIEHNEKRLRKWKFQFAPDLAVQIHPQLTRAYDLLFKCTALQLEGVTAKFFTEPKQLHGRHYWSISFKLFAERNAPAWVFKPSSAHRPHGCPASDLVKLEQRIVEALHPDRFANLLPDRMLAPHCMCCGKALTDPVSMARWIGPECWGSASANLPQIFKTAACRTTPQYGPPPAHHLAAAVVEGD